MIIGNRPNGVQHLPLRRQRQMCKRESINASQTKAQKYMHHEMGEGGRGERIMPRRASHRGPMIDSLGPNSQVGSAPELGETSNHHSIIIVAAWVALYWKRTVGPKSQGCRDPGPGETSGHHSIIILAAWAALYSNREVGPTSQGCHASGLGETSGHQSIIMIAAWVSLR